MSVVSESVSHSTLTTAMSRLDLQSDGLDMRSADTPMPRERISYETISILKETHSKLEQTAQETNRNIPNLRDILTNTSISYPLKEQEARKIMPNHCTRLGKCTYCPIIKKIDNVTCKTTGMKYTTIDLPKLISCELCDIVYLITCIKCEKILCR